MFIKYIMFFILQVAILELFKAIEFEGNFEKPRACLVMLFDQQFSLFKQHNTYFHNVFLPTHISTILKKYY